MSAKRVSAAPRAVLRRLADVRSDKNGVLSVYLDLDPTVFPTGSDRQVEIDSIVSQAREAFTAGDLKNDERAKREEAVERVAEALNDPDLAKGGTRSVAVFAAPDKDLFKMVSLDAPIAPGVIVDDSPYLRPIADQAGPRTWAILLTDSRHARILYGGAHRLAEVATFEDNVMKRPNYGGWSQASYQRHHDDAVRDHLENGIEVLADFYDVVKFEGLAVAAPENVYEQVVSRLPARLSELLVGRVKTEIDFPSPGQVLESAREVFEDARRRALDSVLESLEERDRALVSIGVDDVLAALHERRVMTLVVSQGFVTDGVRCPQCSWLGRKGETCPYDGTPTDESPDLADEAIDFALLQAARVVLIPADAERQPPEPLCALLRF